MRRYPIWLKGGDTLKPIRSFHAEAMESCTGSCNAVNIIAVILACTTGQAQYFVHACETGQATRRPTEVCADSLRQAMRLNMVSYNVFISAGAKGKVTGRAF